MTEVTGGPRTLDERFGTLDPTVWTASYLPAWSSFAAAAPTYELQSDGLHLTIPADQPPWCPDLHDGPLRVSAVQSGSWSGPVGSTLGQQAFRDGLVVTEQQPTVWGFTPQFGRIEVECRATITPRSMFSAWMHGLETEHAPQECGEICIVEIFGDTVRTTDDGPVVGLGCGLKQLRDPDLRHDFAADPYPLDVSAWHTYAVDWRPAEVAFSVDDVLVKQLDHAPDYPMQLVLGVFDFPANGGPTEPTPELVVRRVVGTA